MLTRQRDAIRTLVVALAVPLAPIAALVAYLAMAGVTMLDHGIPAKRVPIRLATFPTHIIPEKLTERDRFTLAGQFVLFCQLFFRKGLVLVNVSDRANG